MYFLSLEYKNKNGSSRFIFYVCDEYRFESNIIENIIGVCKGRVYK
jgi:hypothetical protein